MLALGSKATLHRDPDARMKYNATLQNQHVKVRLRRRVVGHRVGRRAMRVTKVAEALLPLLGVAHRVSFFGASTCYCHIPVHDPCLEPAHDEEVDREDRVRSRHGERSCGWLKLDVADTDA